MHITIDNAKTRSTNTSANMIDVQLDLNK